MTPTATLPAATDTPAATGDLTLTQVVLNLRNHFVHKDLRDVNALHQRVMSVLPDGLGRPDARHATGTLFRVDDTPAGPRLLIQTSAPVDASKLPDGYAHTAATLRLTAMLNLLTEGQAIRYRLLGNPTKRAGRNYPVERLAGKIVAHNDPAAVDTWWTSKATAAGLFLAEPAVTTQEADIRGAKTATDQPVTIKHRAVRFEGTAIISDPNALRNAIRRGIGRGKAHGLGMLTVIPVS